MPGAKNLIWKGIGVLASSAALIVLGVVGLARLTVPDEPTFAEELAEASGNAGGSLDVMPTAVGGELEITGDREATITLEPGFGDERFGLEADNARLLFSSNPLVLDQMSYDGLEFFPGPDACEFTEGGHNENLGITTARVVCEELVDIRDNGSISVDGYIAVPADLIVDLDVPQTGGTIRVGDREWEVHDPLLDLGTLVFVGDEEDAQTGLNLISLEEDTGALFFAYDENSEMLSLTRIFHRGEDIEVDPGACSVTTEMLMQVNPEIQYFALDFSCESVDLAGQGAVPVEGNVVFKQTTFDPAMVEP